MRTFIPDHKLLELTRLCMEEELIDDPDEYNLFLENLGRLLTTHLGGQVVQSDKTDGERYGVTVDIDKNLPI